MAYEIFKGYVETKDKKSIEKFKNRNDFKTYEQVKNLPEFAGVLNTETVLIDVDEFEESEKLMNIVEDLGLKCRVYATTRGKHFIFKNKGIDQCKTHSKTAIGLTVDIKIGTKNSYEVLKYKNKEREIIYDVLNDEDYDFLPKWLLPVKTTVDFIDMEEGDGRNQTFFNYILTLQNEGFEIDEIKECISLINKYVVASPLTDEELKVILRDEAFEKPSFFKKNQFLFDKFAHFLVNRHHIVKINNQLHIYKDGIYVDGYNEIEGLMIEYIPNLNRQKRKEVLDYIAVMIRKNTEPSSANYIAFRNGIYNIETEDFIDFSPDIIITNKIDFNYNEKSYSEIVDKTLNKMACNDKSIRLLLEEVVGYCFYRRNELRKAFILIGDKSNGKSTYIDMVKTLLGDYNTSALDLKELGDRFKTAELFGKLANLGDDIGDEFVANTSVLKKAISGDRLNVERKGQDPFDMSSYAKFIFSANSIPRMGRGRDSAAIVDRLIIVPFEATFSKDDPEFDPYIKYKLRGEEAMEYLIQIALDGLVRVLDNRSFTSCSKIEKELEEYEESNNPILLFFKESNDDDFINEPTKAVYQKYNEFCLSNSFQPMSNIEFSKQVKKHFGLEVSVKKIDGKSIRIFTK